MHSPFSNVSKRNLNSTTAISCARRSNWRRTGGPTGSCRKLEALLIVADTEHTLILSGNGDVIEPDDGIAAIGSGGPYAQAAAKALVKHTSLSAGEIVQEAMAIASEICIYTNDRINIEEL